MWLYTGKWGGVVCSLVHRPDVQGGKGTYGNL